MRLVRAEGKDAEDFLNRVTAGTVKGLEPGQGTGGALLTGQSRMIAQFDLLKIGPTEFLLASPDACADALQAGLDGLLFAEDLSLREVNAIVNLFPVSRRSLRERTFKVEGAVPSFVWPAAVPGYAYMLGPVPLPRPEAYDFDRIGALVPEPASDWNDSTPALEAGVLPWIDRHKGCYPGQEVVERSLNVGHPARVLMSLEREGDGVAEKILFPNGAEVPVLSSATSGGVGRFLVRAPWAQRDSAPEGFRIVRTWE